MFEEVESERRPPSWLNKEIEGQKALLSMLVICLLSFSPMSIRPYYAMLEGLVLESANPIFQTPFPTGFQLVSINRKLKGY